MHNTIPNLSSSSVSTHNDCQLCSIHTYCTQMNALTPILTRTCTIRQGNINILTSNNSHRKQAELFSLLIKITIYRQLSTISIISWSSVFRTLEMQAHTVDRSSDVGCNMPIYSSVHSLLVLAVACLV